MENSKLKLLYTYESREKAEKALSLLLGEKRLASERDATETVYNLFGIASWNNFYRLNLFQLKELKEVLEQKKTGYSYDAEKHKQIVDSLNYISACYGLKVPSHWHY